MMSQYSYMITSVGEKMYASNLRFVETAFINVIMLPGARKQVV